MGRDEPSADGYYVAIRGQKGYQGLTDAQIAEQLNCATKTVERKRKRLREKAERWAAKMM